MRRERNMELVISLVFAFLFFIFSTSLAGQTPSNANFADCLASYSVPVKNQKSNQVLYTPTSPSYSSVLQSTLMNLRFNTSAEPKPQYIVTPLVPSHVQATVLCSKQFGLQVRVRSGGHDYEGVSYLAESPFVIIDLVNLRKVTLDANKKSAWVEAGATLGELYYQVAKGSGGTLGFPSGTCQTIGVGGIISGGGQGSLTRKYGLSADNVLDATIVDANGRLLDRKSMGEDLFWAIRGGGGASFGVILSWKLQLVPVPPQVTVFNVFRNLEQGATELVHRWQQVAPNFPKDLFIRLGISKSTDSKGNPTVGVTFNSMYLGTLEELIPVMQANFPQLGLKPNDTRQLSWIESVLFFYDGYPSGETIDVLMNRTHYIKGYFKGKSDFVDNPISEMGLKSIWKVFLEGEAGVLIFEPYGGRMNEISETETPFPHRAGILYNIQYFVSWSEGGKEAASKRFKWIDNVYKFMQPFVTKKPRTAYLNYKDFALGTNDAKGSYSTASVWGTKYFKQNFKRLAVVKSRVDPKNFFRNEQSIPPFTSV